MRSVSKRAVVATLGLLCLSRATLADSLFVICNSSVTLSQSDLRDLFLGDKQFASGIKLMPADNRAAKAVFLDRLLMMPAAKYSTSWVKKSFRDGVNPPPVKGSDAEAIEYVRHEAGACSYVLTRPGPGVTIVASLGN